MRGLITLTLVLALGWSGWWFFGTAAQKTAIETWMQERREAGWIAEVDNFSVTGFPSRFDSVFIGLTLSAPRASWTWQAPRFQLMALSYKPNHIIAVWPDTQTYTTRFDRMTIISELFRGSLVFKPDTALSLDRLQVEIDSLSITAESGWNASAKEASVAFFTHNAPDLPKNSYDLYVQALEFSPPKNWRNLVDRSDQQPETIPEILLDASITFDTPWDRFAIEGSHPRVTAAIIRNVTFVWGGIQLKGSGMLNIDDGGYLDGSFTMKVHQWRVLLDTGVAAKLLSDDIGVALNRGITRVAALAGDRADIEIPLRFENRLTYIGPIPIAAAPRIY
ncbi:MAG: DUF2125 domain-containing protein [Paracoccaceae bacterium]